MLVSPASVTFLQQSKLSWLNCNECEIQPRPASVIFSQHSKFRCWSCDRVEIHVSPLSVKSKVHIKSKNRRWSTWRWKRRCAWWEWVVFADIASLSLCPKKEGKTRTHRRADYENQYILIKTHSKMRLLRIIRSHVVLLPIERARDVVPERGSSCSHTQN